MKTYWASLALECSVCIRVTLRRLLRKYYRASAIAHLEESLARWRQYAAIRDTQ